MAKEKVQRERRQAAPAIPFSKLHRADRSKTTSSAANKSRVEALIKRYPNTYKEPADVHAWDNRWERRR